MFDEMVYAVLAANYYATEMNKTCLPIITNFFDTIIVVSSPQEVCHLFLKQSFKIFTIAAIKM